MITQVLSLLLVASCIPAHLQKYQEKSSSNILTEKTFTDPTEIGAFPESSVSLEKRNLNREYQRDFQGNKAQNDVRSIKENQSSPFFQVDQNTYQIRSSESEVWEAVLDVLIKNYSLAIIDKNTGVLATDWDSFYLGKAVYRNKLTIRLKKGASRGDKGVEFLVHNNVEKLGDSPETRLGLGTVWLPSQDPIDEVKRVIQNIALLLKHPPPALFFDPKEALSKGKMDQQELK